jgi:tRNA A-37 threonylcarbamoyl transferase component Bud32
MKDKKQLEQAKQEFELSSKAYKLSKGVAKPIIYKVAVQRAGDIAAIESLYEYEGENLNTVLKEASSKHIVNSMRQVIDTMIVLHEKSIFHSDLKPTNIVYKEGKVKIIDFGVSMDFRSPTKLEAITKSPFIGFSVVWLT